MTDVLDLKNKIQRVNEPVCSFKNINLFTSSSVSPLQKRNENSNSNQMENNNQSYNR